MTCHKYTYKNLLAHIYTIYSLLNIYIAILMLLMMRMPISIIITQRDVCIVVNNAWVCVRVDMKILYALIKKH